MLSEATDPFSRRFREGISFPNFVRSAPQGRQQMGETGFCKNLWFSAVSCENLRFPAVFCANLRLPNPLIYRASRKSAKICENLRSGSGFSLLLSLFWRAPVLRRGPSRNCPARSSVPCPLLYRAAHFLRAREQGERAPREGEEEGWPAKGRSLRSDNKISRQ